MFEDQCFFFQETDEELVNTQFTSRKVVLQICTAPVYIVCYCAFQLKSTNMAKFPEALSEHKGEVSEQNLVLA